MATPVYLREDMAIIHAGVNNVNLPTLYSWTSLEGGVIESSSVFTRPGGMLPGLQIGGINERTDVTVHRQMTHELTPFINDLEQQCGNGTAWCAFRMLGRDKNPRGPWVHYTGILKSVVRLNLDANNSAAGFLGLVIALDQHSVQNQIA